MFSDVFSLAMIGFVSSALTALLIVVSKGWHGAWTLDHMPGVQKFHENDVPRIGGLAIFVGLLMIELVDALVLGASFEYLFLAGAIPFIFGLAEDLIKRVSVRARLLASVVGAGVFIALSGIYLNHLDIPGFDTLLAWAPMGIAFTLLAVSGMTNSINIIDGFHGLAAGTVIVILLGFAYVAHGSQDTELLTLCLLLVAVVTGFLVVNYPFGKIFLGDGGAFFLGFLIAQIAIMLPMRNPEVSPWVSLLICAYPVVEVLYSMGRRMRDKRPSGSPDDEHLHTLIKIKLIRRYFSFLSQVRRNAMVAPLIWVVVATLAVIASLWGDRQMVLVISFGLFVLAYHLMHRWLSDCETPFSGVESGN
jgi:UDP-N-acetylmuramyl pentapeptide phosphotransferase/UDP-N-acetylglucosamine-1-phosphate transferase